MTDRRSDEGKVAAQYPKQGSQVSAGSAVNLYVWRYRGGIREMPMVLNLPVQEAEKVLRDSGIRFSRIGELETGNLDQAGRVARQKPKPGVRVRPGEMAALTVYRYERSQTTLVKVPRLVGIHIEKARAMLEEAGLRLGRTYTEPAPSRRQTDFVFRQEPGAGAAVAPGGTVHVWVYQRGKRPSRTLHRLQEVR
jgi:beta-lactam-binding protein with PASTA domain